MHNKPKIQSKYHKTNHFQIIEERKRCGMENQITLNEWMEWKEDIRRKLQETAGNFVYIGYRLKQIRDSGMLGGCSDIFEFAQKEYGLGKSTVSRFIAINEKFSEGGNSLELRSEYRAIGSSKLAEMLTLPDAECQLITEKTTVKEIRELKNFDRQQASEEDIVETVYNPLQKCIIDFLSDEKRKDALNQTMELLAEDPCEMNQRKAAELINPGEYATHKKGIVFLFLYDYNTGVKYKKMGEIEPVSMTWTEFLAEIIKIYQSYTGAEEGIWNSFYHIEKEEEKVEETQQNQGFEDSVATSQQGEKTEENEEENDDDGEELSDTGEVDEGEEAEEDGAEDDSDNDNQSSDEGIGDDGAELRGDDEAAGGDAEQRSEKDAQIVTQPIESLRRTGDYVAQSIASFFDDYMSADGMEIEELAGIKVKADELVAILEQMIELKKEENR